MNNETTPFTNDVELWLYNNAGIYKQALELAQNQHTNLRRLSEQVRYLAEGWMDVDSLRGLAADMMQSAMDSVDWREVATDLREHSKEVA